MKWLLIFALIFPVVSHATIWDEIGEVYQFHEPVPAAQYTARVMALRIQGGPHDNTLVYDWWRDDTHGLERIKAVAAELGINLRDGWTIYRVMEAMRGNTYVVTVRNYDTINFQECSRVDFLGYALP
jgi:hypothetical protein